MEEKKNNDKENCSRCDVKRRVSVVDDIAKKKEDVLLKLNGVDCRRIVFLDDSTSANNDKLRRIVFPNDGTSLYLVNNDGDRRIVFPDDSPLVNNDKRRRIVFPNDGTFPYLVSKDDDNHYKKVHVSDYYEKIVEYEEKIPRKINDKEVCLKNDDRLKQWLSSVDDSTLEDEDIFLAELLMLNGFDVFLNYSKSQFLDNKLLLCEMLKQKESIVFNIKNSFVKNKSCYDYGTVVPYNDNCFKQIPLLDYYGKNDGLNLVKIEEDEEKKQKKITAKSLKLQYKGSIVDKK